jgi:hypothetical protein
MTRALPSSVTVLGALTLAVLLGSSVPSAQAFGFRDRVKPTAPTNLVVTATTEHTLSLAWGPSTDNSGRFSYLICCPGGTNITVSQTQTSYTVEGLQSGQTYFVRVTDDGPYIWYTTFIDGQAVSTLNSRTKTFTCAAVQVPTGCVPLDQATTYTFTVRARDVDGNNSSMSDPVLVTTDPADPNDVLPPTQPGNVTAQDDGGFVIVDWDASTDDLAPPSSDTTCTSTMCCARWWWARPSPPRSTAKAASWRSRWSPSIPRTTSRSPGRPRSSPEGGCGAGRAAQSTGVASTGPSKAMNSRHGSALTHEPTWGRRAGP